MSTLYYVQRTNRHEDALPGATTSSLLIDAAAALVPAEVLALHAVIIGATTTTSSNSNGQLITTITDSFTLRWVFWVLIGLAVALYVTGRIRTNKFDQLDIARALIPAAAFACWTMLQKATAFDANWPGFSEGGRFALAAVAVIALGTAATLLAYSADQKVIAAPGERVVESEPPRLSPAWPAETATDITPVAVAEPA